MPDSNLPGSNLPDTNLLAQLYESIGVQPHDLWAQSDVARIEIHHNRVLGLHLVPGLEVDAEEQADGVKAKIRVTRGTIITKPVQVCFGMVPEDGVQRIVLDVEIEEQSRVGIIAHCIFPNARRIRHEMDANLTIGKGAGYAYLERHVHGIDGGVLVLAKTRVSVLEKASYQTDFELIRGRAGEIDLDIEVTGQRNSVTEVSTRISAAGNDRIRLSEAAHLVGEYARGALTSHIALRNSARADIYNFLNASAPYARGHVDCKEIVQDDAVARAIPTVEVTHPKAHVTHEAAIGSVDSKQLETLMSRGLDEDQAIDLIIQGLLGASRPSDSLPSRKRDQV